MMMRRPHREHLENPECCVQREEDSDPIESDTFEGLVAGVERRAMEFGVTARRTSVWEEFDEEALELLSIATKPAALAGGGIPKLAAIHESRSTPS